MALASEAPGGVHLHWQYPDLCHEESQLRGSGHQPQGRGTQRYGLSRPVKQFKINLSLSLSFSLSLSLSVGLLHGDMSQGDRDKVITTFKKKEFPILVATDVAGEIT